NLSNSAKNATATFVRAGVYQFAVAIRDADGQIVTSNVSVTVNQTLSGVIVAPASATVAVGLTRQFTASARDQFGNALASQPAFDWSLDAGSIGSVNAAGLYQAPATAGSAVIRAATGP